MPSSTGWAAATASARAAASGSSESADTMSLATIMLPAASGAITPSGWGGRPSWISAITACQISAGRPPPVTPCSGVLSS